MSAVMEKVVLEQFLDTVPIDLRIWLCERKPSTVAEASSMADDYRSAHRRKRFEGGKTDPKKDTSSKDTTDTKTEGSSKDTRKSQPSSTQEKHPTNSNSQSERSRDRAERRCFNCHERGHRARDCPRAFYCAVTRNQDSLGVEGRDGRGPGVVGRGRETEVGGDGGTKVGCVGEGVGGDGSGGEVVGGMVGGGPVQVSWGCEEVQGVIGMGSGGHAMVERSINGKPVQRSGTIEGVRVDDIVLDTGCAYTMIRRDFVPPEKLLPGSTVSLRCAHGDVVTYPLATMTIEIGGLELPVTVAVADRLPVSALLGTDVSALGQLINQEPPEPAGAMVMTRAQTKAQEQSELQARQKQDQSQVTSSPVTPIAPFASFDNNLFRQPRDRHSQTRREKRNERHRHGLIRAKDPPKRPPTAMTGVGVDRATLQQLQETDESLSCIRDALDQPSQPFVKKDGLLFRQWEPRWSRVSGELGPVMQFVLPKDCRQSALELAHSIPLSGHLGRKKTYARLAQRFFWPSMSREVAEYCRSCEACQKCSHRKPPRVPMIPLPTVDVPFSRVAMDLIGPLPRSRAGNRYVLVLCDYATRYPEAVPMKNIDAENVAEELVQIFSRVGLPQEILTDQGANFTSRLLRELYRLLRVQAIRTSPYHPQTDGLVERFNQTLKSMLRKCASDEGKDWDKLVPFLLFAYREVPQESTGFSPFELVYGRDVRGPLDVLRETWVSSKKSNQDILSYVLLMRDRLTKMTDHVHANLKASAVQQKKWYDRNARGRCFTAGDQVLVLLPSSTSKLTARWQGPYQVVKRVGEVNYLIYFHYLDCI